MATYHHSGFDVVLRFSYHRENPNHDDDVEVLYSFQRSFFIRCDEFLSGNEDMRLFFAAFLLLVNISDSVADSMVDESISLAHLMVNDPKNVDRKVLRIAADVWIRSEAGAIAMARRDREFADEMARARRDREFADVRAGARRALPIAGHTTDDHDAIARATRESMQVVKFVPATKSSIDALEKVTILDNNSCQEVEQCRACLETLSTAAEIIRMPCSHIFHGNCIVRWLESSNLCPLCRFAMPH